MRSIIIWVWGILLPAAVLAQHPGILSEPGEGEPKVWTRTAPAHKTTLASDDTIRLPFRESFNGPDASGLDTSLWLPTTLAPIQPNHSTTSAINPPDVGTLAFDGTDGFGRVYDQIATYGRNDSIYTKCIDLSDHTPADSLYLSFWYQPGGQGDLPEEGDSLWVEFRTDPDTLQTLDYSLVWSTTGDTLNTEFVYAEVPVIDSSFFHKCFQMKFGSTGSLNGRFDVWHIDRVILDDNRTQNDTLLEDVAIQSVEGVLFDSLYAMPLLKYEAAGLPGLRPLTLTLNNRSSLPQFRQVEAILVDTTNGSIVDSWTTAGTFPQGLKSITIPAFELPTPVTPAALQVRVRIGPADSLAANDSIAINFPLNAVYQYGDDEPEIGYGLFAANRGFSQAFSIPDLDTLRAIWVNWFPTSAAGFGTSFQTALWTRLNESPDSVSYTGFGSKFFGNYPQEWVRLEFVDSAAVSGRFRVGFIQTTNKPLGVGIDLNHPRRTPFWYNFNGEWTEDTEAKGNLAIRLELANNSAPLTAGVPQAVVPVVYPSLRILGNPVTNQLRFELQDLGLGRVPYHLLDQTGRIVRHGELRNRSGLQSIDVRELPSGVYYFNVLTPNRNVSSRSLLTEKIIIQ